METTYLILAVGFAVTVLSPARAEYACGRQQSCYQEPSDCTYGDCDFQVVWEKVGGRVNFKIAARVEGFVAVGISEDRRMGGDDVLMCLTDGQGGATFQHRYNDGRSNIAAEIEGFEVTERNYTNGVLSCRVVRDLNVTNHGKIFDLGTKDYYLLFAQGPLNNGNPIQHEEIPKVTPVKVNFGEVKIVDASKPSDDHETGDDGDGGAVRQAGMLLVLSSVLLSVMAVHM